MTEMLSSGSEESQSDDSQEIGNREPEKGDSPNPNNQKITFGELLKLAQARNPNISSEYDEPGTSELKTSQPKQRTVPSTSSDPSTTTWEVLTIPKGRREDTRATRKGSSQDSSADPQQQAQE